MNEIKLPLNIDSLELTGQSIDNKGNIILDVVSKNNHSTCHQCGKPATKRNGVAPIRLVRHLPIFDKPVYLRIQPSRCWCEYCDDHPMTTEQYDWRDRNATTTKSLEAYLMRQLIHSTVEDVSKKGLLFKICGSLVAQAVSQVYDIMRFLCRKILENRMRFS